MKIVVYFENGRASEVVAQFASEELYAVCLPALEDLAGNGGYIVTESCREDECVNDYTNDEAEEQAIDDASWRA
jgi:hypothetical protein